MSFTSGVKTELVKIQNREICCLKAECYGIWLFSKCFTLKEATFVSENTELIHKMAELAAVAADVSAEITFTMSRRRKPAYRISLKEPYERERMLGAFGYTGREPSLRINYANFESDCCYAAFLRGVFLACGSMSDPDREYHLEFASQYKILSGDLGRLLQEADAAKVRPSQGRRKGSYRVYLTDSGQIEDFLTYIGATAASMELMQIKMFKEAKNNINRKTNFETANMDKTYEASARQTAAIAFINDYMGLEKLEDELRTLAELRLHNPEMTLREMAELLGMTRSRVNYRFRKITEIGEALAKRNAPELLEDGGTIRIWEEN